MIKGKENEGKDTGRTDITHYLLIRARKGENREERGSGRRKGQSRTQKESNNTNMKHLP